MNYQKCEMFNVDRIIVNWMIKICSDFQSLSHAVFYGSTENEDQLSYGDESTIRSYFFSIGNGMGCMMK